MFKAGPIRAYPEFEYRARAVELPQIKYSLVSEGLGRRAVLDINMIDLPQGQRTQSLDIVVRQKGVNVRLKKLPEESPLKKQLREALEQGTAGKKVVSLKGGPAEKTITESYMMKSFKDKFNKRPSGEVLDAVRGRVENTTNKQLGIERKRFSSQPAPTQKQSLTRDVLTKAGGTVIGNLVGKFAMSVIGKIFHPVVIGPADPEPTEEDIYEMFLKELKEIGYELSYDDIRDEKEAINDAFKKNLKWHHTDDQTFWKNYPAKSTEDMEHWDTAPPEERIAFEIGVLAEHMFLAQPMEEFNPQSKPWIWQLPDDRDDLVKELSERCTIADSGKAMYDYLATYKYKGKWVLPRFVAIDAATDALYEHLGATEE